jgi:hypothetical protein
LELILNYNIGAIIDDIQKAGYIITAVQQFLINSVNSTEFLEIYKGVLPEYMVYFQPSFFCKQIIIFERRSIS